MNPFKVGDKVRLKKSSYDFNPIFWRAYDGYECAIVTGVYDAQITTDVEGTATHYTHFELYKEEKDMTSQTHQKTKRVPFTHELWEKYKDKGVVVTTLNGRVLEQFTYFNLPNTRLYAGVYGGLVGNYYSHHLFLEIPVTTKRIPFNPELKDAKVFTTDSKQTVVDWVVFKDGQVACQWPNSYMGYYPTALLEMEIEEDV